MVPRQIIQSLLAFSGEKGKEVVLVHQGRIVFQQVISVTKHDTEIRVSRIQVEINRTNHCGWILLKGIGTRQNRGDGAIGRYRENPKLGSLQP